MVTLNRIDNLITYWILFNDINNSILDFNINYIKEKYDIIFNKEIVNSNELFKFFSSDKELQEIVISYCKKWKMPIEELINNEHFGILVFTIYFTKTINKEVPSPYELLDKFKLFFGNSNYIKDKNAIFILHDILKRFHENYKDMYPSLFRDLKLNSKINNIIN